MTSRCRAIDVVSAFLLLTGAFAGIARAAPAVTVIGSGLTGRPYVLRDDIVLESTGLVEAIRDFADWRAPAWLGWNDHSFTFRWSDVAVGDGLLVAFNA